MSILQALRQLASDIEQDQELINDNGPAQAKARFDHADPVQPVDDPGEITESEPLEGHPAPALAVMGTLSRRLRDADAKRVEFAPLGTLARVAGRLLELVERFGVTDDETTLIALPLSQEELAGWTGASIESVGRALQTMRTLEWIQTRRREIRILDVEALRRAVS